MKYLVIEWLLVVAMLSFMILLIKYFADFGFLGAFAAMSATSIIFLPLMAWVDYKSRDETLT